ncbi:hypothetical protein Ciccas_006138 [Cichlidogyrus casuarinus]|uniref:Uncharacterized protein n=1 Tax=Cichlidogyrus casuarinus TaxID=1844966 RepID=A0ABD2Q6P0_9PLAT
MQAMAMFLIVADTEPEENVSGGVSPTNGRLPRVKISLKSNGAEPTSANRPPLKLTLRTMNICAAVSSTSPSDSFIEESSPIQVDSRSRRSMSLKSKKPLPSQS